MAFRQQLQRPSKEPQRMADVASQDQAVWTLMGDTLGKGKVSTSVGRAIMKVGGDDNAHDSVHVDGNATCRRRRWRIHKA